MTWSLDASVPTLDAEVTATLDGWSTELSAFIVTATVVVAREVNKAVTAKRYIDKVFTWRTI